MVVAHSMLLAIYRMLSDGAHFHDLGPHFHDEQRRERVVRRSVQRLQELGYRVTIEAAQCSDRFQGKVFSHHTEDHDDGQSQDDTAGPAQQGRTVR
jgi:hypothetical protein